MSDATKPESLAALAAAVAAPQVAGGLGAIATRRSIPTWYEDLEKPDWRPPRWVFGPVWTLLYLMMGVASWLVWRERGNKDVPEGRVRNTLVFYGIHLVANALWSIIFFGWRRVGLGFLWILLLVRLVGELVVRFARVRPLAGLLLVPYLLWTLFATALNLSIWRLNR